MKAQLAYQTLTKAELDAYGSVYFGILTNERILGTIDDFHLAGIRCAVVVVQKDGNLEKVLVRERTSVGKEFPFDEVAKTISTYDTETQVCIVLVRDDTICAVIVGRKDK